MGQAPSAFEMEKIAAARSDEVIVRDLTNMAMANTGLLFVLFYDHLLTLPDEIKVIWPMPWKIPKMLFMVNRYFVPAFLIFHTLTYVFHNIPDPVCTAKIWTGAPCIFSLSCVQGLLMFRVEAIYRGEKRVRQFLYGAFGLQLLATMVLSGFIMPNVHGYTGGDMVPGCLYVMPKHMELIWLPGTLFESILAIMTIYQAFVLGLRSRLLRVLVRDAFTYFLAIFACLCASLIYPIVGQRLLAPSLLLPSTVVACLGTARITINLRSSRDHEPMTPVPEQHPLRVSRNPSTLLSSNSYKAEPIKIRMETSVTTKV